MELKKYFHNKILNNLITLFFGAFFIALLISTQTYELIVITTYVYLFIVFTLGFQVVKSTVKRVRSERHKLNKEWWFIVLTSFIAIALSVAVYYGQVAFYRAVSAVLLIGAVATDYCLYRFVYLPKIFLNKKVRDEVLYFSWKLWGDRLDKGEAKEKIAELLVRAETISNSRFDSNVWGARFSSAKVYNEPSGEDSSTDNNVAIPVAVKEQLMKNALAIVDTYQKKN